MSYTLKIDTTDLTDYVENVDKRIEYRKSHSTYLGRDRGSTHVEGMGVLSFALRGRPGTENMAALRKAFEPTDETLKFYYGNSDKYYKVKTVHWGERDLGQYPTFTQMNVRLETVDQFQYGTATQTKTATIGTTANGSVTFNMINNGNIWVEPDIEIEAIGTVIQPTFEDEGARELKWTGTLSPNETLTLSPDYEAQIDSTYKSEYLEGDYPRVNATGGGTETWLFTHGTTSKSNQGTITATYTERWY